MFEEVLLLVFCSLAALAGLAVVAWEVASGRILSIDSLTLTLICLSLSAVFGWNAAWFFRNGEVRKMLSRARKPAAATQEAQAKSAKAA